MTYEEFANRRSERRGRFGCRQRRLIAWHASVEGNTISPGPAGVTQRNVQCVSWRRYGQGRIFLPWFRRASMQAILTTAESRPLAVLRALAQATMAQIGWVVLSARPSIIAPAATAANRSVPGAETPTITKRRLHVSRFVRSPVADGLSPLFRLGIVVCDDGDVPHGNLAFSRRSSGPRLRDDGGGRHGVSLFRGHCRRSVLCDPKTARPLAPGGRGALVSDLDAHNVSRCFTRSSCCTRSATWPDTG